MQSSGEFSKFLSLGWIAHIYSTYARVAATFNSPKYCANPSRLYELPRTARIEATDGYFLNSENLPRWRRGGC